MTSLVGRDAELARVAAVVGLDGSGPRSAVLLGGDAGVGKTRLLTELAAQAEEAGWQVVAGHCLDFGDSALPYLPVSEIVGRLTAERPDVVEATVELHPALLRLQPGRRMLDGGQELESGGVVKAELLEAVAALLRTASQEAPLLVLLEDLHWADGSTRDLVSFLFARGVGDRVGLVASYRADDLHRRHPLRREVAEWSRMSGVERLLLEPLGPEQVRTLVGLLHPEPLADAAIRGIVDRAEGNAFFVEELVGAFPGGQSGVPGDLADVLLVRLEGLDDETTRVVRAASVAGRRVSHGLLGEAAGIPAAELDRGLREALERHVLVVSGGEYYEFRHALLAEAVYDDLLPGERVALHAAYAEALRSGRAPGTAAELARHARQARDFPTALAASLQAAREARGVGGAREAAQHYQHALGLAEDTALPEGLDRGTVVAAAVESLIAAGHPAKGVALARDQLARAAPGEPPLVRGRVLTAYADALALTETDEDPLSATEEAVRLVPDDAGVERARALGMHARMLYRAGRLAEAVDAATAALELAQRLELPRLASDIRTTVLSVRSRKGDAGSDEFVSALEAAIGEAHAAGAGPAELRGLHLLGMRQHDRGDLLAAAAAFERAVERGEELGTPWSPYAAESRWQRAHMHFLRGDWDLTLRLLDRAALPPAPASYDALYDALVARVLTGRGDPAAPEMTQRLRAWWSVEGMVAICAGSAELAAAEQAGDGAAAVATYDAVVAGLSRTWSPRFAARVRLAATALGAVASGAHGRTAEERRADGASVARLADDARWVIEQRLEGGEQWGPEGLAWRAWVEAEVLRWHWRSGTPLPDGRAPDRDSLVTAWETCVSAFATFDSSMEVAMARLRLVEVLLATGDTAAARRHAAPARELADHLGARPLLARLAESPPATAAGRETLTPREREILALVADGRTNGEIGRELFIATKTVSVHVSNILGKLGASSRTEAAALARRDGLVG